MNHNLPKYLAPKVDQINSLKGFPDIQPKFFFFLQKIKPIFPIVCLASAHGEK